MDRERDFKKPQLLGKHYEEISKWFERVALLILASLVVRKIFTGVIADPVVYVSAGVALMLYITAYKLLIKS